MNPAFQQLRRLLKQFGFLKGLNEKATELWLASEWFDIWLKQCRISPASQTSKGFLKKILVDFFFNHYWKAHELWGSAVKHLSLVQKSVVLVRLSLEYGL